MSGIAERLAEVLAGSHDVWLGDAYGHHGVEVSQELADHLADALLPVVEREIAAARGEALRSPYDEDGNCEGCGNGSWKAHAPTCGWADLAEARAEAWDEGEHAGRTYQQALTQHAHWSHIGKRVPEPIRNPYRAALSPDPDRGEGEGA